MQVTSKEVRPRTLEMTIQVEADQVNKAFDNAFRRAAQKTQVPGFRQGKAPRALLERIVDPEAIKEDAQEIMVREAVKEALTEANIDPFDLPELEKIEFEQDKPATITITVPLAPEVKLGEYKGIPAERKIPEVKDEMIDTELEQLRQRGSKLEPAEAAEVVAGDLVRIDLAMDLDGKPLPGESRTTIIDVGQNVPSVDAVLIGAKPGDDVKAEIVYPEDDPDKNLAGKTAVAKMKIIERMKKILPELNDEFVKEISEFKTLDELKADIRDRLGKVATDVADRSMRNQIVEEAINRSEALFPDSMVEHEVSHDLSHLMEELEKNKLSLEDYLKHQKKEMSEVRADMELNARMRIKGGLVLAELAKAGNIGVSEEDINAEFEKIAETYKVPVESVRARYKDEQLKDLANGVLQRKIVDLLVENAKIKEVAEK